MGFSLSKINETLKKVIKRLSGADLRTLYSGIFPGLTNLKIFVFLLTCRIYEAFRSIFTEIEDEKKIIFAMATIIHKNVQFDWEIPSMKSSLMGHE